MSAYQTYREQQIEGASPIGLVLLTYEALLKSLQRAKYAAETGNIEHEANHISRAMEALIELSTSLDFEQGGEMARRLGSLYAFMRQHLLEGMTKDSVKSISEVFSIAQTLSEGWHELAQQQDINKAES